MMFMLVVRFLFMLIMMVMRLAAMHLPHAFHRCKNQGRLWLVSIEHGEPKVHGGTDEAGEFGVC
jgi:hypothetical protein